MASGTINLANSSQTSAGGYLMGKIVWSSKTDADNNKSQVTAKLYVKKASSTGDITIATTGTWDNSLTINGSSVSKSTQFSVAADWVLFQERTVPVQHNDDGKKSIKISGSAYGPSGTKYSGLVTKGDGTVTLDTIPRASSVSASKGTLGTEQTLTVTRASSSFTHTITYSCGSASGTVCTKSDSTSVKWTPPLSLAKQNTTGSSVSIKLTITTYNGDSKVGSAKTATFTATIPSSVKPTASLSLSDPNGYVSTYGGYVQGQSQVLIQLTGTGSQGSTIEAYKIDAGGVVSSGDSKTIDLPKSGDVTIKGTVTDSRSRSGTDTETISVLAYTAPKISKFTAARCASDGSSQADGAYVKATISASITSLSSKNTASYQIQYKVEGSTSGWTSVDMSAAAGNYAPSNVFVVFAADTEKAFTVRAVATDAFGTTYSVTKTVPVAFVLLQCDTTGTGLAVGQKAVDANTFAVGIPMKVSQELYHGGYNYFETDWIDLGLSSSVREASSNFGNYIGCAYRVIGRHVFVAFSCGFDFDGSAVFVNANKIASEYRPQRNQYAMCATGGRSVARVIVNSSGNVVVDWVQVMSASSVTESATVNWVSGYVDYWI